MWKVVFATDRHDRPLGKSRIDHYRKNHPQAFAKLRQRLNRIVNCLNEGLPPEAALGFGWVHPEKNGVFAIDPEPGFPALRMYCALVTGKENVIVFTIGEKKRQQEDIRLVLEWKSKI